MNGRDLDRDDLAGLEHAHAERVRWQDLAPRVRPDADQRAARRQHSRVELPRSGASRFADLLLALVWGGMIAALLVGWWSS